MSNFTPELYAHSIDVYIDGWFIAAATYLHRFVNTSMNEKTISFLKQLQFFSYQEIPVTGQ